MSDAISTVELPGQFSITPSGSVEANAVKRWRSMGSDVFTPLDADTTERQALAKRGLGLSNECYGPS